LALAEATGTAAAERASGSSFYNAMRILPRPQRAAMFEIYSFCRQVDDIADSSGPRGERRDELDRWRADIDALYAGRAIPRTQGLVAPVKDFALKREDFHAIIEGMEMDVVADIRAPDDATLDRYCDRVASAVGRLYLPSEALRDAGIAATDPATVLASPALGKVCARLVERARAHFAQAGEIMARSPRRTVRAPRIMGEAYRLILDSLVDRGWSPPRRSIHLSRARLLWIIMRHAFI